MHTFLVPTHVHVHFHLALVQLLRRRTVRPIRHRPFDINNAASTKHAVPKANGTRAPFRGTYCLGRPWPICVPLLRPLPRSTVIFLLLHRNRLLVMIHIHKDDDTENSSRVASYKRHNIALNFGDFALLADLCRLQRMPSVDPLTGTRPDPAPTLRCASGYTGPSSGQICAL